MSIEQKNITLPAGLPGLSQKLTRFAMTILFEDSPFFTLQSLQDENVGFIMINPFALFPDYEFDLPDTDAKILDLKEPEQAVVFCIVNASHGLKNATINMLAPLVLNVANGVARQVVLNDKRYSVRHPLPAQSSEVEEG